MGMAGGDKVQYDSLKATEENEFYNLMDLQKKRLEKLKNNQHAGK